MVSLSFRVKVWAPFDVVWPYFLDFSRLSQWDPNTTAVKTLVKKQGEVGSQYDITTVFNGNTSQVLYETRAWDIGSTQASVTLYGQNSKITAQDQISCIKTSDQITEVVYRAEICLRGVFWLFTPFVRGGLDDITESARVGLLKKAMEKWGRAE